LELCLENPEIKIYVKGSLDVTHFCADYIRVCNNASGVYL
jgi:hypothetical protein